MYILLSTEKIRMICIFALLVPFDFNRPVSFLPLRFPHFPAMLQILFQPFLVSMQFLALRLRQNVQIDRVRVQKYRLTDGETITSRQCRLRLHVAITYWMLDKQDIGNCRWSVNRNHVCNMPDRISPGRGRPRRRRNPVIKQPEMKPMSLSV